MKIILSKLLTSIVILLILSACGTPNFTTEDCLVSEVSLVPPEKAPGKEEQLETYNHLREVSEREYKGLGFKQVYDACDQTLKSIDPENRRIVYGEKTIVMKRKQVLSYIIFTELTHQYWIVKIKETENGVSVKLRMKESRAETDILTALFAGFRSPDKSESTDIPIQECNLYSIEYNMFFGRLDYELGLADDYLSCEETEEYIETHEVNSGIPNPFHHICN